MLKIKKLMDLFLDKNIKVAVLKGKWGVGKTHFWNKYIKIRMCEENSNQIAYSYISLFGKSNLDDIKKSIFQSTKEIKSKNKIDDSFETVFKDEGEIYGRLPWIRNAIDTSKGKVPLLSRITKYLQIAPPLKQYTSLISSFEYSMVNNYIICIDDIERKGEKLTIKEIMGLVDELAQRKSCKVILIFNENSLGDAKDKNDFETYREKIVDIELSYNPTYDENLGHIIACNERYYTKLLELIIEFDIKNIRVIKKIKWILDEVWLLVENREKRLIDEVLTHIALFCWSYYKSDNALDFDYVYSKLNSESWLSILSGKEEKDDDNSKLYKSLASNLSLSGAIYDVEIVHFMKHGFFDSEVFREKIDKLSEEIESDIVSESLERAYDIYYDSFKDNLTEFKDELKSILDENLDKIKLSDFSSAIDLLVEYGEDVESYIVKYVGLHRDLMENIDLNNSLSISRIKHPSLVKEINQLHEGSKNLSIDTVASFISKNSGWNPSDIDFLCSLTTDDYYHWMMSDPTDITKKIRSGLLRFRNLEASNEVDGENYKKITDNVVSALRKVGSLNELNKKRVKYFYGIELEV